MRFHKQTTKAFRNYLLAKYARLTGMPNIPSLPYILFINPSSCCNLQCAMCVEDGDGTNPPRRKRPSSLMTPELFQRLMEELGPYLFMVSLYNWGEPLLNKHLPEFIRLAKSHDIYVDLNTNLSLDLSDLQLGEFLQSGVDNVVVSIDGFSQATYGTYRLGGSFELAKENVTRLALLRDKLGLTTDITWKFLLFSFNEHEVELARDYCQKIGISFAAKDAIIDVAKHPEWLPQHRADESTRKNPGWPFSRYCEPGIKAAGKDNTCAWHYYYSAVNADGTVSPCCAVDKVAEDFGQLDNGQHFIDLWNNDRFRSARGFLDTCGDKELAAPSTICHRCPYQFLKDLCTGTNKQVIDNFSASDVQDPLTAEGFKLLGEPATFREFMEKNMAQFVANADGVTTPQRDRGFTAEEIAPSICTVCGKQVVFASKRDDFSLRETHCPECKASQRTRDLAQVILDTFGGCRSLTESLTALQHLAIYEAAANGPVHELLRSLPGYVCSEYYDDVPLGANSSSEVRCEDLERLTFAAESFDLVITQDVFEHIANPWQAFAEIERVLKTGGSHIFTVPLHEGSNTVLRARPGQGKTDFLLPPVYHGDPLRPAGTLVYNDFGDDLGSLLTNQGFTTDIAHQSTFYDISQIPLILEDVSYRRYLERRQRGEMLAFFLYNSVVFRSKKSGELQGTPAVITIPAPEIAPEQLVLTGELAFEAGQVEAARSLFAQALERVPGDSDALNDLGALAYRDGNLAEAETFFYRAIDRKADNWAARTNLADLYSFIPALTRQDASDRAFCPCCGGSFRSFISGGPNLRPNACCPRCGSLERHRLLWLYLQQKTNLFRDKLRVLHFAPEKIFQDALRTLPNLDYVSADLYSPLAMVKMDITDITFPDDSFDVILCSHVLEHIPDDRKAMAELYRVLKPGGWAILQVPIDPKLDTTYEDPSIVTPEERKRHFGQDDHVRWYGRDYGDRLKQAGFNLRLDQFGDEVPDGYGIIRNEEIYWCAKDNDNKDSNALLSKKIEAINSFINFSNGQEVPKYPVNIFIESSNICDMKCVMCGHFSALNPDRLVSIKANGRFIDFEMIKNLKDILPYALNVNCFGFGEATIHKQFKEIIDYIASYRVMIHFFTHGMHLDEETCQFVVDKKVNRITFSFSGAKKEVYENIYIGCDFERVISNMKRLAAIKRKTGTKYPYVAVNSLSFRDHVNDLVAFVDLMADCGVDEIILSQLYGAPNLPQIHSQIAILRPEVEGIVLEMAKQRAKEKGITLSTGSFEKSLVHGDSNLHKELSDKVFGITTEQYDENITQYDFTIDKMKEHISTIKYEKPVQSECTHKTTVFLDIDSNDKDFDDGLGITPPCLEPFQTFYVASDGLVKPCCYWGSHEYMLGSTGDGTGLDVWNGEGYSSLRKGIVNGKYFKPGCTACASRKTWPKSHNLTRLVATYQSWILDCYGQKLPSQLVKSVGSIQGNDNILDKLHAVTASKNIAYKARSTTLHDTSKKNREETQKSGKAIPLPPDQLRFMAETPEEFLSIGDRLVKELQDVAGLRDDSRILDIGSGYGRLAHAIMRCGCFQGQYTGLEILKLHSEWCRDQLGSLDPRFRFVHLDVRNDRYNPAGRFDAKEVAFPYADASFDVICLTSVFTHMYEEEVRHYLKEIGRLLAVGGRCYATFFLLTDESLRLIEDGKSTIAMKLLLNDHCRYLNPEDPLHAIGYDEGWLQQLFESCGLNTEKVAHGSWCGRKTDNIYQDVLVISRAPAAKDKHAERKGIK